MVAYIHINDVTQNFIAIILANVKDTLHISITGISTPFFIQLILYSWGWVVVLICKALMTRVAMIFSVHLLSMKRSHTFWLIVQHVQNMECLWVVLCLGANNILFKIHEMNSPSSQGTSFNSSVGVLKLPSGSSSPSISCTWCWFKHSLERCLGWRHLKHFPNMSLRYRLSHKKLGLKMFFSYVVLDIGIGMLDQWDWRELDFGMFKPRDKSTLVFASCHRCTWSLDCWFLFHLYVPC